MLEVILNNVSDFVQSPLFKKRILNCPNCKSQGCEQCYDKVIRFLKLLQCEAGTKIIEKWWGQTISFRTEMGLMEVSDNRFFQTYGNHAVTKKIVAKYQALTDLEDWEYLDLEETIKDTLSGLADITAHPLNRLATSYSPNGYIKNNVATKRLSNEIILRIQEKILETNGRTLRKYLNGFVCRGATTTTIRSELTTMFGGKPALYFKSGRDYSNDILVKVSRLSKKWIGKILYLNPTQTVWEDVLKKQGYQAATMKVRINPLNFLEWEKAVKDKSIYKNPKNRDALAIKAMEGPFALDAAWRLALKSKREERGVDSQPKGNSERERQEGNNKGRPISREGQPQRNSSKANERRERPRGNQNRNAPRKQG